VFVARHGGGIFARIYGINLASRGKRIKQRIGKSATRILKTPPKQCRCIHCENSHIGASRNVSTITSPKHLPNIRRGAQITNGAWRVMT